MKEFLDWSIGRLNQAEIDFPRMEAEVLFARALKLCREEIYRRPERVLTESEKTILCNFVDRRVLREPVAYIIERKEFWSLDFKITPDVLIPRPETETLVETLLLLNSKNPDELPLRLLEIGTGSGAIAVVAAQEIPNCRVTATDYFLEALAVARLNAKKHGVSDKINFLQSDMFLELPIALYDCIVSNPPYIQTSRLNDLMPDVLDFEPKGKVIFFKNSNVLGVVGQFGTFLGNEGININDLAIGMKENSALAAINVDTKVSKEALEKLKKLDACISARYIEL